MTIKTRGNPGAAVHVNYVHYDDTKPQNQARVNRGEIRIKLLCGFGGYHVNYTEETGKVTCPECNTRLSHRLVKLANKLPGVTS